MDAKDMDLLITLKTKEKLTPTEKATLKNLQRTANKEGEKEEKKSNVFATTPTTNINPLPIRFTQPERTGLSELAKDIKRNNTELVIMELGSEREINETKLIRAAVYLLKEKTHKEIIKAIKDVKLNMIR